MMPLTPETIKFDFFDTAIADILRAIDGGSLVGSLTLSFCAIDYMGFAFDPTKRNTQKEFKKFVQEYMGAINNNYTVLSDHIYAIRNSLVHTYGQSSATDNMNLEFILSHQNPENHLKIFENGGKQKLWINHPDFISELITAVEKYFREHIGLNQTTYTWALRTLKIQNPKSEAQRNSILKTNKPLHSRSHRFLSILEEVPPTSLEIINTTLKKLLNENYSS